MQTYEHSIGLPSLEAIKSCFTDIAWARGGREYRADHRSIREGRWNGGIEGRVWVYEVKGSMAGFALHPGSWKVMTGCVCGEAFCAHAARVEGEVFEMSFRYDLNSLPKA